MEAARPPGTYTVETDDELLESAIVPAYRRVATLIRRPGRAGTSVLKLPRGPRISARQYRGSSVILREIGAVRLTARFLLGKREAEMTDDRAASFTEMAVRCREMAAASKRPGALLNRAEAFEAEAKALRDARAAPSNPAWTQRVVPPPR
jgi:hypothetical protein